MKITSLKLTIEPWRVGEGWSELRAQVVVDGTVFSTTARFGDDDFESRFDLMMDEARKQIKRLVKTHK